MNFKSIFSSWYGLGLLIFILQYPFQYLFKIIGVPQMPPIVALGLASYTASMLFTYYAYPHIMTRAFKIYAALTAFCASLIVAAGVIMSNSILRDYLSEMLRFQTTGVGNAFAAGALILVGFSAQLVIWYLFISMGNKQIVNTMKQAKK